MPDINKIAIGVCNVSVNGQDVGFTSGGVKGTLSITYSETTYDSFGSIVTDKKIKEIQLTVQFSMMESSASTLASIMGASVSNSSVMVDSGKLGADPSKNIVTVKSVSGNIGVSMQNATLDEMAVTMTPDSPIEWTVSISGKISYDSAISFSAL